MAFQKATKKKARLRLALFGPSGAGKTYTALRIAKGIGGTVAVIDTERNTASKYSDRFDFDAEDQVDKSIDGYIRTIKEAAKANYNVLIIDSITHGWQDLLQEVEKLAKAKYGGNTWSAWSEGTPKQKKLINAILDYPGHLIVTMRSKTEWGQEAGSNGKNKPVRIGLAPEQGKGIEYEFDMLMELTTDHLGTVIKDRSSKFQDKMIEMPDEDFGKALADWLEQGEEAKPTDELRRLCRMLGYTDVQLLKWLIKTFQIDPDASLTEALNGLSQEEASRSIDTFKLKIEEKENTD
jgi:nicotinamide riboside kinase/succinate dehydrogenase flavin-adding protein (antitoxin of CptAB toxin-antitoxin module)